jgi:phenylacetyl-CoA:acceptor oxidoreductase subunit 1
MTEAKIERRGVLKALAVGATAAAGLRAARSAHASGPEGESPHKWAMVIDQSRCTGCQYCVNSCQAHNDINPDIRWNRVIEQKDQNGSEPVYLSRPCMHCEQPPCKDVCMVGATYVRADGIVMMDYDKCIGCRYCEVACPYYGRAFNWEAFTGDNPFVPEWGQPEVERRPRGVVEKCSFCYQRIDRGIVMGLTPGVDKDATPACVAACPVGARAFGDLNDPNSNVSQLIKKHPYHQLRDDLGTGPRVYYLPANREGVEA